MRVQQSCRKQSSSTRLSLQPSEGGLRLIDWTVLAGALDSRRQWSDQGQVMSETSRGGRRPLRVSGAHGGNLWWNTSPAVTEKGSVFKAAAVWPLTTPEQAEAAIATIAADPMFTSADHRMTAYRVEYSRAGKKVVGKAFDDDGEQHGGQRLLGALTKEKVSNAAVVVARWYGGVNIGKARFEHICERARWVLREAGHVTGQGVQHNWGSKGHSLGGQSTCELVAKPEGERAAGPLPNTQPQSKRKREGGDSGDDGDLVARRAACAAAALRRAGSSVSSEGPTTAAAGTLATDRGDSVVVNAPRKELARGGGDSGREKAHIIGEGVWRGKTGENAQTGNLPLSTCMEVDGIAAGAWECGVCTFINSGSVSRACEMCDTRRP